MTHVAKWAAPYTNDCLGAPELARQDQNLHQNDGIAPWIKTAHMMDGYSDQPKASQFPLLDQMLEPGV